MSVIEAPQAHQALRAAGRRDLSSGAQLPAGRPLVPTAGSAITGGALLVAPGTSAVRLSPANERGDWSGGRSSRAHNGLDPGRGTPPSRQRAPPRRAGLQLPANCIAADVIPAGPASTHDAPARVLPYRATPSQHARAPERDVRNTRA